MGAVIDLIDEAEEAGVVFALKGDGVVLRGDPVVVPEWLPLLRPYRRDVLVEIQRRQPGEFRVHIPGRPVFGVNCPQGIDAVRAQWPAATTVERTK